MKQREAIRNPPPARYRPARGSKMSNATASKKNSTAAASKKGKKGKASKSKPEAKASKPAVQSPAPVKLSKQEKEAQRKAAGKIISGIKSKLGEVSARINLAVESPGAGRFARVLIFGHNLSSVLRSMGRKGITYQEARCIMDGLGLPAVRDSQIRDKIYWGSKGGRSETDSFAELSKAEWAKLESLKEFQAK